MIRLVLHTGRFRDMGYETALSGPAPTAAERDAAERLLSGLRRGAPDGGVGIVVPLSVAGRAIDEILALATPEPLPAEAVARLQTDLSWLHREALPGLLDAAAKAATVSEARSVLRRGLDDWLAGLSPLPTAGPARAGSADRARSAWPRTWKVAVAGSILALFAVAAYVSWPWQGAAPPPATALNGPDDCRPNGADDAAAFGDAWRALEADNVRQPDRGDPFWGLPAESAAILRSLAPHDAPEAQVCRLRRVLAMVHRDLDGLRIAASGALVEQVRTAIPPGTDARLLDALEELARLKLPKAAGLCGRGEAVCLPVFADAEAEVLLALHRAHATLLRHLGEPAAAQAGLASRDDVAQFELALAASAFRSAEITLRGELHRAGAGDAATDLFDPLRALADCPRPGSCVASAAGRVWPRE